jgi:phage terminase large subunit GpA-like protein
MPKALPFACATETEISPAVEPFPVTSHLLRLLHTAAGVCFPVRYKSYINSEEWRELRQTALDHYGERCDKCGKRIRLHGHHKNYSKPGIRAIRILCEECHERLHFARKAVGRGRKGNRLASAALKRGRREKASVGPRRPSVSEQKQARAAALTALFGEKPLEIKL